MSHSIRYSKYGAEDFVINLGQCRKLLPLHGRPGTMDLLNTLVQKTRRSCGEGGRIFRAGGHSKMLQNAIVKGSCSSNYKGSSWCANGRYLERVLAQGHEQGFNAKDDHLGLAKTMAAWQKAGDPHVYKFIISPEEGGKVNLKEHARLLIRQLENDQGIRVEWGGIVHKNSGHPHIHVVIRGVLSGGQVLEIDQDYIKRGIRQRSRELLTQELGFRSKKDILVARERSIYTMRVTELDRILVRLDSCSSEEIKQSLAGSFSPVEWDQITRRLDFLVSRGLAIKNENGYSLNKDCLVSLREYQREHDIAASLLDERKHMIDPDLKVSNRQLKAGEEVCGRVASVIYDEAKGKRYVLLETTQGEAIRVRMATKMEQERDRANFQRGDFIYLKAKDIEIAGKRVWTYVFENYKDLLTRDPKDLSAKDCCRVDLEYLGQRDEVLQRVRTKCTTNFQDKFFLVMEERRWQLKQYLNRDIEMAQARGPRLRM